MHDVDTQPANQDDSTFPDDVDYITLGTRSVAHFTTPLLQMPNLSSLADEVYFRTGQSKRDYRDDCLVKNV
jgi:hypothetical protein